jgi:hypothetical protein
MRRQNQCVQVRSTEQCAVCIRFTRTNGYISLSSGGIRCRGGVSIPADRSILKLQCHGLWQIYSQILIFPCKCFCLIVYNSMSNFSAIWRLLLVMWQAANLDLCLALMDFSSEGSFTCHTCFDTGPQFMRSNLKERHHFHGGIWTRTIRIIRFWRRRSNHCAMGATFNTCTQYSLYSFCDFDHILV